MKVGTIVEDPETGDIYKCVKFYQYIGGEFIKWRWGRWHVEPVLLSGTYNWKKAPDPELRGEKKLQFGTISGRKSRKT